MVRHRVLYEDSVTQRVQMLLRSGTRTPKSMIDMFLEP